MKKYFVGNEWAENQEYKTNWKDKLEHYVDVLFAYVFSILTVACIWLDTWTISLGISELVFFGFVVTVVCFLIAISFLYDIYYYHKYKKNRH